MSGSAASACDASAPSTAYFVIDEGWEYVGFISAAAVALSALGAGPFSVDRLLGLDRIGNGYLRAALTAAVGLAGAASQLKMFWERPPPKA